MTKEELEDWKKWEKQEYDFLDMKDLDVYIPPKALVGDVMRSIEIQFGEEYKSQYPDDEIFNVIDEDDFAQYVYERYGIKTYEVTETRFNVD